MPTTTQAKEFMDTLLYLVLPCDRELDQQFRCNGCSHPHCRGSITFDEEHYKAQWHRLDELGTEEVFADLSPEERATFWYVVLAMKHITNDGSGVRWTVEKADAWLLYLVKSGEFERMVTEFYNQAHPDDPILEEDDDSILT